MQHRRQQWQSIADTTKLVVLWLPSSSTNSISHCKLLQMRVRGGVRSCLVKWLLSRSPVPSARACNSIGNLWGNPACWAIQSARVSAVQREVVAGARAEFMMLLLALSLSLSPSLGFVVFLAFLILLLVTAIVWNAPPSHCPLTDRERESKCHFQVRGQIELTRGCVGAVVCHSLSFLSHSHTDLTFLFFSLTFPLAIICTSSTVLLLLLHHCCHLMPPEVSSGESTLLSSPEC